MNCYNKFAHIYDKLIRADVDYKKWSDFIIEKCVENNLVFDDYLDLACGTGNLTENLCPKFKNTWAVDLSQEMLSEAENKFRSQGLKPRLACQDISNLNINRKFDLITCCLDSTNYIIDSDDLKKYFKAVSNHLKEGGVFIFDINSYYKLSQVLGNNDFNYDDDEVFYYWENQFEDDLVSMYISFFVRDGEFYKRFDEEHEERAYKEEDIEKYLKHGQLNILDKVDCYSNKKVEKFTERITYLVKLGGKSNGR
ncbi:SAM-dependent methyltransferase [Clostridium acetobutylicum]|uniref:S-adenosylmethionine-dependent methyltransferase n=2 Tax=Clostridium acetobutylicum (strain ATCC 824 / DSM 792 / JCM 1419 / IAM 19013 / LMG 5710 / NBRC 13948 / NRRL B-527 / VKM B-1787 / 2291 / W) TaxID=272562 RepID=Q97GJ5_CLOAB|nr:MULTISPECIES: class I SAM-dependent methyltransferase [Clostridium]AAK80327.1 S-adenosylmethionine-dependent methyltransferase [Clostridium acetobutylicum ATCC 824]ADZ21423.1 S-adenosylmethionine-dependent methyltransferase [Clostridium acetobutylicum EA 2018]AEI33155.1 S-adenosylmethionine-dependent methyltransferase [Clostridium acetobutylicum DSM 1731]AWV79251.1 class I SAM-dependent methyltransferase [Clostridium acetobutylicum]MBC2394780.1 class I SAM-dependent methyltransferase [Clost